MAYSCACAFRVVCIRTHANGSRHYGWQCRTCGEWTPATKAQRQTFRPSDLQEYDPTLQVEYWRAYRAEQQAKDRKAWEQRREQETEEWFYAHEEYLASPEWRHRRDLVLTRDEDLCTARLGGCQSVATQVHHLSYRHWRNEPLWDLTAICASCHEQVTDMDRAARVWRT